VGCQEQRRALFPLSQAGVCMKQQMAGTQRGAHLWLQIRTRLLDGDWETTFQEWSPGL
jgi:hypothetical protein